MNYHIKKKTSYKLMALTLWCSFALFGFFSPNSIFAASICVFSYFFVGTFVNAKSSVHMMFFVGYSTFIFLPALLNWFYLDVGFELFFISSFASVFFLHLTRNTESKQVKDFGLLPRILFICFCFFGSLISLLGYGSIIVPLFPFAILLLAFSFKPCRIFFNAGLFLILLSPLTFYLLFSWNGFGRLVVFSWLILAIIYFLYASNISFNKYIFGLIPSFGSTFLASRNILKFEFSGFEKSLNDSAFGPYRLASGFIEHFNNYGFDFSGFFDQLIFTFFVFVPRDLWPSKPFGFGFEYTVRHLSAELVSAGHSIASTLVGDHIYFLGYCGILTNFLVLSIIAGGVNIAYSVKGLNGYGVIVLSSSMSVLVWGGMSSFAARIALACILFFPLSYMLKLALKRKLILRFSPRDF